MDSFTLEDKTWPLDALTLSKAIANATTILQKALPSDWQGYPIFGVVGGSGLNALEEAFDTKVLEVPYNEIEGFPVSKGEISHFTMAESVNWFYCLYCLLYTDSEVPVPGHNGKLVFGSVGVQKTRTVLMSGRAQ